jgi:DNA repair exonuclease SbcCD nuclease subunit
MEPLRFIHAADLHLDSPFRGVGDVSPELREQLQASTMGALERIVDHTIGVKADFLLLAGDLYDSHDRSLRALLAFRRQMERLADRDISVYIVHGNHDPLNGWGSEFQLPPNVTTFSGRTDTEPFIRRGKEVASITGVSYTRERVMENLAASFKSIPNSPYSVALLHANVGGHTGHADYAPATLDELSGAGFDYWALGHVHTRSVLSTEPAMVVYPGNPQGRHAREQGPRGCYQVDVDSYGRAHLEFIETNVVRWAHLDISICGLSRISGLVAAMLEKGKRVAADFDGSTVVRCSITGSGPLHRDLHKDGIEEELREELHRVVPAESVRICTGPPLDLETLARTETVVSDFLNLSKKAMEDPAVRQRLAESLAPLFKRKELSPPDDARLKEWIERAGILGVDLLLDS